MMTAELPTPSQHEQHALLEDGSLVLTIEQRISRFVRSWIPWSQVRPAAAARELSRIHVQASPDPVAPIPAVSSGEKPTFQMFDVRAWVDDAAQSVLLNSIDDSFSGRLDLQQRNAKLYIADQAPDHRIEHHVGCGLTVTAGLLLNRQGGLLLHAAAFVDPNDRAWLLVGDSRSGKSSTCASLIRAGWDYLADDQVVVSKLDRDGGLVVEGWARAFNLDVGFHTGVSQGLRSPADPGRLGAGRWRRGAMLGGLLFPRVEADRTTCLEPIPSADVLSGLIRQSPWLLADARAAPSVLGLMTLMARLPARRLRLGTDSYGEPRTIVDCLGGFLCNPMR